MGRPAGRGELIIAVALADENSDDLAAPAARAERAGDGWLLSGVKTAVPAGTSAGLLLVPAAAGQDGAAVFGVAPGDSGVTVQPQQLTGASAARVVLDRARLPGDRLLGSPAACRRSWAG